MTLKIKAYQKNGIKTDELIDEFEFCCWDSLNKWLNSGFVLHKCQKCKNKEEKNGKRKSV